MRQGLVKRTLWVSTFSVVALCVEGQVLAQTSSTRFVRGDSNGDSSLDVSDAVNVLVRLFAGDAAFPCADASDANDDGAVNIADAVRILSLLFQGGPELPEPALCGVDPTGDALECASYAPCEQDELSGLSDIFDDSALDPSWTVLRPNQAHIGVAGGSLSLTANGHSLWFQASRGPLIHKLVTGDFRVTARVHARRASDESLPPNQNIHLGGLMARDPASESGGLGENYVFIVVGQDENDPSIETKTTANPTSTYEGPPWPDPDADLRICRLGSTFRLWKRAVGSSAWTLAATFDRPDLPDTLQVGPFIYAASGNPDLLARFDDVVFAEVVTAADCESDE